MHVGVVGLGKMAAVLADNPQLDGVPARIGDSAPAMQAIAALRQQVGGHMAAAAA